MGLIKGSPGYNIQAAVRLLNHSSVGHFDFWNALDPDRTIYNVYGFLPLAGTPGIGTLLVQYPTMDYHEWTVEMFIDDIREKFIEWLKTREGEEVKALVEKEERNERAGT